MRVKSLIALLTLFSTTALYADCVNTSSVSWDANDVQRDARDVAWEAERKGYGRVAQKARELERSAFRLENTARGYYSNCYDIRSDFSAVSYDYRELQRVYQGNRDPDLGWDFRQLASSYRDLSSSVNLIRDDRPRRYDPPRPVPPRRYDPPRRGPRYDPPPRRPGRRYDPTPRRRGPRYNPPGRSRNDHPRRRAPRRRRA